MEHREEDETARHFGSLLHTVFLLYAAIWYIL